MIEVAINFVETGICWYLFYRILGGTGRYRYRQPVSYTHLDVYKRQLLSALDISGRLGFDTVNLDNYIGYAQYGRGEDGYVCAIGHVDVCLLYTSDVYKRQGIYKEGRKPWIQACLYLPAERGG